MRRGDSFVPVGSGTYSQTRASTGDFMKPACCRSWERVCAPAIYRLPAAVAGGPLCSRGCRRHGEKEASRRPHTGSLDACRPKARRLAPAWPINNRPQVDNLPHQQTQTSYCFTRFASPLWVPNVAVTWSALNTFTSTRRFLANAARFRPSSTGFSLPSPII